MANRMASAIANRMAKPMRSAWQNYAPNPNPNPNTQNLSPAGCLSRINESIHRYGPYHASRIAWMTADAAQIGGVSCR